MWITILLVGLAVMLPGCRGEPPLVIRTATPAAVNAPTSAPVTAPQPATARPQPTQPPPAVVAVPTAGPLTAPAVVNRYRLPAGQYGESLEVTPGRVWVGVNSGALLEYDSNSGGLVNTYPLVGQTFDGIAPVKDLAFDGQHLWAIITWQESVFNQVTELVVLDPASGQAVQRINVTDQDPVNLGLTPGRVWTQNLVYDSATLAPSAVMMNSDATVFGPDGEGGIWAGGSSACDTCPTSLYRYPVDDIFNARPGPMAADQALHLLVIRQRLWVVTDGNFLDGYDLAQIPGLEDIPVTSVDLNAQMELPPAAVVFDGTALWLLSSAGVGGGVLYQYDPLSGQMQSGLQVGEGEGEPGQARVPVEAVFDGRDIWVLTALDLAQVGLPWTR